jgi:hypothetical protein
VEGVGYYRLKIFGIGAWVVKKREEQRLEAAQMKFFETLTGNNKIG